MGHGDSDGGSTSADEEWTTASEGYRTAGEDRRRD